MEKASIVMTQKVLTRDDDSRKNVCVYLCVFLNFVILSQWKFKKK